MFSEIQIFKEISSIPKTQKAQNSKRPKADFSSGFLSRKLKKIKVSEISK
jgi:hypothetical protein